MHDKGEEKRIQFLRRSVEFDEMVYVVTKGDLKAIPRMSYIPFSLVLMAISENDTLRDKVMNRVQFMMPDLPLVTSDDLFHVMVRDWLSLYKRQDMFEYVWQATPPHIEKEDDTEAKRDELCDSLNDHFGKIMRDLKNFTVVEVPEEEDEND